MTGCSFPKPENFQIEKGLKKQMKIYLASASPRRKEILKQVGISFKVVPSTVEEHVTSTEPHKVVEELSYQKAVDVCGKLSETKDEDFVVIGADTVVACWGEILGKPKDKQDATDMLQKLSGQSHQVSSATRWTTRRRLPIRWR